MNEASSIIIPDASTLAVDTSCIDVSEVENQEDKDFLLEKGGNILQIVARAALDLGKELVDIEEHFAARDGRKQGLLKFYKSLGISDAQQRRWRDAYKTIADYTTLKGEEVDHSHPLLNLSDKALATLRRAPTDVKEEYFHEISEGATFSCEELEEVVSDPKVKLSKAEEMLAKASARKQKAQQDRDNAKRGELEKTGLELKNAEAQFETYKQQIADLEALIEEEKLKTAEEAEAKKIAEADKASMEKELQKLKFDDAKVRAERVKKLSTTLTVSIPQALADVSKFFAEIDHYPEEVRQHIYNSAKSLANEIADKL